MAEAAGPLLSRPVFSRNGIFFWLLGFVVRVRYTFFLTSLVLAMGRRSLSGLLVWMGVSTVAVLLHELGHAAAARRFGSNPTIELYGMGGLTSWVSTGRPRWWQRLATSLAGPGIGFVAGGLVFWLAGVVDVDESSPYLVRLALHDFMWVSFGWGLFNLLPILPLDGGSALEAVLERFLGADRARYSVRVCSCVVGGLVVLLALATGMVWAGILCALFTYNNLMAMRGLRGVRLVG